MSAPTPREERPAAAATAAESAESWPAPRYAWYVVGVLAVANLLASIDRTILNLLITPIKSDLALSDTQMGLIAGAAFGIVHTLMILPFGWRADRAARNRIITLGITFWSILTASCGLARTFTQLFAARMGVGIGEATLAASVAPLISDYFPRLRRTLPLSVFSVVGAMGNGVAFLVGGALSAIVAGGASLNLPLLGELRPWQTVFVAVGLPGLLWALLTLTVREPSRHRGEIVDNAGLIRLLRERANVIAPHFLGNCCFTIFAYGAGAWTPTVLMRVHGWSMQQVGYTLGLMYLFVVFAGGTLGGLVSQWMLSRGRQNANLLTMCLGITAATVPGALVGFMPSGWSTVAVLVPLTFLTIFPGGPSTAAMQEIAPSRLRGRISALYHASTGLLGLSFGALVIGLLTDHFFHDEHAVAKSISLAAVILCPLGALLVFLAARARAALGPLGHA
ncbi:MAG TPA: MFS transporter [Myxococcota bacterium]|nr:MFS transporter [Myxococcota bacterium]